MVVRGNFGRKVAIGTLATAAAAAAIFYSPPVQERLEFERTGGVSAVRALAEELPERNVVGRLTGFSYKALERRYRGDEKGDVEIRVLEVAGAIEKRMPKAPSVNELRAQGLVQLLQRDKDAAIETLTLAHEAAPNDPVVMNDLAAALIERGDKKDLARALELSQNAWRIARSPEAAWNR
ncbi:MAG TPA: hypothetical protein VEU30_12315, partial [Thermoanaerobaculia bacterium]|nr:hypothetical protein [Thermoanaerobaculia bacterium]